MKASKDIKGLVISALIIISAVVILLPLSAQKLYSERKTDELIILGQWNEDKLRQIIAESRKIRNPGERVEFISKEFLGVKYQENTLIGDASTEEIFVINLDGMDCFTFIDYVEALRLSSSYSDFERNLKRVRYQSGKVVFEKRNHFFTDWLEFNSDLVREVTKQVGGDSSKKVEKALNDKGDGDYFLPGLSVKRRAVNYIPSEAVGREVIGLLRTGDYAGVFSNLRGLDVSHTGIIIKKGDKTYLRHASSRQANRKVLDEDLLEYLSDKPGLILFRPE